MTGRRLLLSLLLIPLIGALLLWNAPANEQTLNAQDVSGRDAGERITDIEVVQFDISPRLDEVDIENLAPPVGNLNALLDPPSGLEGAFGPQDADGALQTDYPSGVTSLIPAPIVSFNGPGNISMVSPPDPVGDVGPNHYVAMSNLSTQIFDKSGNSVFGPVFNNAFWAGFGGPCQTNNAGDPIVLHDQLSDRWYLTQFTSPSSTANFICLAVSTSADPTGTYYRWAISNGSRFPDYPKYGIWPDAFYMSTRDFSASGPFAGIGAYALDRADLVAGDPTPGIIAFLVTPSNTAAYNLGDGLLPSDLDGNTLPPAGSPNYYIGSMDNGGPYGAPQDALTIWEFDADFATPANSSFTLANTVPVASFDSIFPCSPNSRSCIPQPNTTNKVDIQSYRQRVIHRLAYRNFGTHEALVTNQSVEAAPSLGGVRWYEIRDPGGTPTIFQQGTYAPGTTDGIHRWMGSAAMDSFGNMALGYSASNSQVFPSVWYTGRLDTDPLGTLPQGEESIIDGTGSQTGSQRWGDYSSLNVDPVDDCTFWYVNEWVPTTSSTGWQLRIGAFRFPECESGATPTPTTPAATVTPTTPAATATATQIPTSIQLSDVSAGQGSTTPWFLLALVGMAGIVSAAWLSARRR
ncbi:MAG: hypothetical protein KDD73_06750 [Anaerolineales bacterium]|nr:hypothetical protein [Anaerolineales bacterium]